MPKFMKLTAADSGQAVHVAQGVVLTVSPASSTVQSDFPAQAELLLPGGKRVQVCETASEVMDLLADD